MICQKCGVSFIPTSGTINKTCINCYPFENGCTTNTPERLCAGSTCPHEKILDDLEKYIQLHIDELPESELSDFYFVKLRIEQLKQKHLEGGSNCL